MPQESPPGTISSSSNLVEYYVANAEPVDRSAPKGYSERCIPCKIFKRFPDVHSLIHSHADAVVPYTISGVPLKPSYHMAGFLGMQTLIYDNAQFLTAERRSIGDSIYDLRESDFSASCSGPDVQPRYDSQGPSIQDCVLRAFYNQKNAAIQTIALNTRFAHFGVPWMQNLTPEVHYLSEAECVASAEMTRWSGMRPWKLWLREVEAAGLYVNLG